MNGETMKVVVDWDLCESHGQCEFAAPNVFSINDNGDLDVLEGPLPESEVGPVEQAVRRCPVQALKLNG
jgi:ferredoxin